MSYAFIRKKGFNTMKQIVNFDELFDFIERNTEEYAMCDDCESLISAVVTYAEYAVRKKYEGNDEQAGLFMASALNYAFLSSFDRAAQYYRDEVKLEDLNERTLILHYALKLVEALYEDKPYEESKRYQDLLVDSVSDYILSKDAEEDDWD